MFQEEISKQLAGITEIDASKILECVESTKNKEIADFAVPVPKLNKFKKLVGKPDELAAQFASKIQLNDLIKDVSVSGTYLNFKINRMVQVQNILKEVIEKKEKYGFTNQGQGKKIIVEFSSPNIAKPFHAGHLRSTIIGNFMVQLFTNNGYQVVSMNYLGDWGKQYGLLAIGFEKHGNEQSLLEDPIKHLFEVYVKINEEAEADPTIHDKARAYFKKMEDGDEEALGVWKRFRDLSIEKYKGIYKRLNVSFDIYSGESLVSDGMIVEYDKLEKMGLIEDSEGAKVIDLSKQKLGKVLVKKSDGSTLYITRDIAAAFERKVNIGFDHMYYVVASQQDHHFRQLFAILEKMNYDWKKDCTHINYGLVKGMSTRKGTVVFLEDILNETKRKMLKTMQKNPEKFAEIENPEEVADIVGLSAVVIQDFNAKRNKDYDFNWKRMLTSEGDTGPYLQYAHARLSSIERKSGVEFNPNADLSLLVEPQAFDLAIAVGRFPEVIQTTLNNLEPSTLTTYLFELCRAFSSAYAELTVKGQEKNVAEARLALFVAAKQVLNTSLKILGLVPLERM
ncbi:hypothetical protein CYY_002806 [Polysphondylium violaceum]|uniref:arginine--tRNA ligase n=1 Tax=Polysphondylium violaceum TaxID=133409 RepID=A0A8J4V0L1_9MYCE|nr:hypothetical protein CYY_002806 [Polysphondylium violaceum]